MTTKLAYKIKVTIHDQDTFNAWTFGDDWNEWATLHFEKAEADKGAAVHNTCIFFKKGNIE